MAECRESEYEADCESEYESNNESKNESKDKWDVLEREVPFLNITLNRFEHKKCIMNRVIELTFGHPVRKPLDFVTRCPLCPTSWKGEIELERAENNGSVSYEITINRTDDKDKKVNAVVWVRILNGDGEYLLLHHRFIQRVDILPGNEIKESCKDAISAKDMLHAQENKLLLLIEMHVQFCHGRFNPNIESDTSTDG